MVCGVVMLADGFYMMKNTEIVGDLKRGLSTGKVYFFVCGYCKKKKIYNTAIIWLAKIFRVICAHSQHEQMYKNEKFKITFNGNDHNYVK